MKQLFTVAAFAAVSLIVVDCNKSTANKGAPPLPVNVVTVVEKEVNEWDEFTGRLDPVESVEIRPRVSGYITEIHFEAGAIVKKGDLLYVIDPRPYQADFGGCILLDAKGFIKTGTDLSRDDLMTAHWPLTRSPYLLETSLPGVFAVGDVRSGNVKRVASAVGEGSIAVASIHQVLRE